MSNFLRLSVLGAALALSAAVLAAPSNDDPTGRAPADAAGAILPTYGNIMCTAAINSTGTVAGGLAVNRDTTKTLRLGVGTYQVSFVYPCNNITAARGWARIVQPDTLTAGTLPARSCITADRAGDLNGVWVQCHDGTGALADSSFFLFVLK